jgi:SdpC family antimicrobial peptide
MLKQLSKSIITKFFVYTWLLSLSVLTACNKTSVETVSVKALSGEELFTAIFFGVGEVAEQLTVHTERTEMIKGLSEDQKQQMRSNISDIVWQITNDDPAFFETFKGKITSGDHLLVKRTIQETGVLVFEKMKVIYPELNKLTEKLSQDVDNKSIMTDGQVDPAKVKGKMDEYKEIMENNMLAGQRACSFALICVAYFVIAVHNTAAITVAVAVAAVAAVTMAVTVGYASVTGEGGLEFEMMVNEVTNLQ